MPVFGTSVDDGAEVDFTSSEARETGTSRVPVEGRAAWKRLLRMSWPRATRANVLGALLALLLGAGIAAQVQLTNQRGLDELSQTDLVRVLDDISLRSSRLDQQVRELRVHARPPQERHEHRRRGARAGAEARRHPGHPRRHRSPPKGPGSRMRITDPTECRRRVPIVLDLIQELRDAGAESIHVGGVRVVALVVRRRPQRTDPGRRRNGAPAVRRQGHRRLKTLSSAMTIPGGIVETVRQKGAEPASPSPSLVEITSLHRPDRDDATPSRSSDRQRTPCVTQSRDARWGPLSCACATGMASSQVPAHRVCAGHAQPRAATPSRPGPSTDEGAT